MCCFLLLDESTLLRLTWWDLAAGSFASKQQSNTSQDCIDVYYRADTENQSYREYAKKRMCVNNVF